MSWRLGAGVGLLAAVSIAAVVISIMSAHGPGGAGQVKGAIRWPTSCPPVRVQQPSRDAIMGQWAPAPVQSADIVCGSSGPQVAYARFRDGDSLNRALAARQPSQRYCELGAAIVLDGLAGVDPTVFTDMCRTLGGAYVDNVR